MKMRATIRRGQDWIRRMMRIVVIVVMMSATVITTIIATTMTIIMVAVADSVILGVIPGRNGLMHQ